MNYKKLYDAVREEYSEDIALSVCIAFSIHMQTDFKEWDYDDIQDSGRFQKRIEENIRDGLWGNDDIDLIIDLESRVYQWDISNALNGLGGCKPKLFKEIKGISSVNVVE